MKILCRMEKGGIHLLPSLQGPAPLGAWTRQICWKQTLGALKGQRCARAVRTAYSGVCRVLCSIREETYSLKINLLFCNLKVSGVAVFADLWEQFYTNKILCTSHAATPVAVRQTGTQSAALPEPFEMKASLWRSLSAKEINFTTEVTLSHGASSCQRQVNSTLTSWHSRRQEAGLTPPLLPQELQALTALAEEVHANPMVLSQKYCHVFHRGLALLMTLQVVTLFPKVIPCPSLQCTCCLPYLSLSPTISPPADLCGCLCCHSKSDTNLIQQHLIIISS